MNREIHFMDSNNANPGIALTEIQHLLVYIGVLTVSEAEQVGESSVQKEIAIKLVAQIFHYNPRQ